MKVKDKEILYTCRVIKQRIIDDIMLLQDIARGHYPVKELKKLQKYYEDFDEYENRKTHNDIKASTREL